MGLRPREYQLEILERARDTNVIAYLDTGAGKTLIAVMLVKEIAERLKDEGTKKLIFFLAPKVELVKQQAGVLQTNTPLVVRCITGELGVDAWGAKVWNAEFQKNDVLVCTPQILLNVLRRAFLKMDSIGLIVFDECHHCKKKEPYNCIMQEFYFDVNLAEEDRPRIFGMTASPLDTKAKSSEGAMELFFATLERSLDAKIITVEDQEEVRKAAPLPTSRELWYPANIADPASPAFHALVELERIQADISAEKEKRNAEWQALQKRKAPEGGDRMLDDEVYNSETAKFSRVIGSLYHVLQEVGPYAALVCLQEVLRPPEKNIYLEMHLQSQLRLDQVSIARLGQAEPQEANLLPGEDSWWGGGQPGIAGSGGRSKLGKKEEGILVGLLGEVVHVFVTLMTGLGLPGLTELQDLPGAGNIVSNWQEQRKTLRRSIEAFESRIDRSLLAQHLLHPETVAVGYSLVTPKTNTLVHLLLEFQGKCEAADVPGSTPWSCIIFTEQKISCMALSRLFAACKAQLTFLRPAELMGYGDTRAGLSHTSAMQTETLKKFRTGATNLLFATAVAEEGLDISHCSLIVRFTLPPTARQYIQSRGRARAPGSQMVLMLETGSPNDEKLVQDAIKMEAEMLRTAQSRANLAPDQVEEVEDDDDELQQYAAFEREYRVAATGAKVTLQNAKALIHTYCQKLPSDKYTGDLRPRFGTVWHGDGNVFQSDVYLPGSSPVKKAEGSAFHKKSLAVASACLAAIRALHQAKALNDHLVPESGVPALPDQLPGQGPGNPTKLEPKVKLRPNWPKALQRQGIDAGTSHLYRAELTRQDNGATYPGQALGILTPGHLPDLPATDLILGNNQAARLAFHHQGPVTTTPQEEEILCGYHNQLIGRNSTPATQPATSPESSPKSPASQSSPRRHTSPKPPPMPEPFGQQDIHVPETPAAASAGVEQLSRESSVDSMDSLQRYLDQMDKDDSTPSSQSPSQASEAAEPEEGYCSDSADSLDMLRDFVDAMDNSPPEPVRAISGTAATLAALNSLLPNLQGAMPRSDSAMSLSPREEEVEIMSSQRLNPEGSQAHLQAASQSVGARGASSTPNLDILERIHSECGEGLEEAMAPKAGKSAPGMSHVLSWDSSSSGRDDPATDQPSVNFQREGEASMPGNGHASCSKGFPEAGALVVPLVEAGGRWSIDWDAVRFAAEPPPLASSLPNAFFKGRMVVPNYRLPQPYKVRRWRRDLSPTSVMPSQGGRGEVQEIRTFEAYYRERWGIEVKDRAQPLLECQGLMGGPVSFLVPELCALHPLSDTAYEGSKHVGSILWCLLTWLKAHDFRVQLQQLQGDHAGPLPPLPLVREALLPRSCGQQASYEKLEILGDAVLKYQATLHCFKAYPQAHEGQLTVAKGALVSNQHLAQTGLASLNLHHHITLPPSRFGWTAGCKMPVVSVKFKVVADVVEALIGAHLTAAADLEAPAHFLQCCGVLPEATHQAPTVAINHTKGSSTKPPSAGMARVMEGLLGYTFKDRAVLLEACTHASWQDGSPSYQRLEFLGDAVLDLMVTQSLVETYPDIDPDKVTNVRSAAVNNARLACIAAAHRCHQALRFVSKDLLHEMTVFVRLFEQTLESCSALGAKEAERLRHEGRRVSDEVLRVAYDRLMDSSFGLDMAGAPKAMADMVEALAGAVCVDNDFNLAPVFKVMQRMMAPLPDPETVAIQPTRLLLERASKRGCTLKFHSVQQEDRLFTVHAFIDLYLLASAQGQVSKKVGHVAAARKALDLWSEDFDYRGAVGQSHDWATAHLAAEFAASRTLAVQSAKQAKKHARPVLS